MWDPLPSEGQCNQRSYLRTKEILVESRMQSVRMKERLLDDADSTDFMQVLTSLAMRV